ncbi:MAG: hypothetical protein GX066_01465 [Clostridiaceae bacterium]|nr:hypothetical protein [Clostridiaceae bacterium]
MKNEYKTFYILSIIILILLSIYPIYMGIAVFLQYLQNGYVTAEEYPKYIIPYTPMCIAIIVSASLLPLIYKLSKRYSLIIDSCIGIALFLAGELFFEQIKVIEGYTVLPLQSWQYSLCAATPEVLQSIGEPIYAENNPVFKLHFYMIAIVIILNIIGLLYGFMRMFKEGLYQKKKSLVVQLICITVFVGLCILACFTAFYRNGTLHISPLSAFLTGLFFIVFGVTFGTYFAGHFYGKSRLLSVWIPAATAMLTTIAMYIGELLLMDGYLFVLGKCIFFEPLGTVPFSPCDILIILISGIITASLSFFLNRQIK